MNREEITVMLQKGGWKMQKSGILFKTKGTRIASVAFSKKHVHMTAADVKSTKVNHLCSIEMKDITLAEDGKMVFNKAQVGGF